MDGHRGDGPRSRGGQEAVFADLFRDAYPSIRSYARRRLPDDRVDDVVAETFLVAWRRFGEVPTDMAEARLWLYRTADYTVRNSHRSLRRRNALGQQLETEGRLQAVHRTMTTDEESEDLTNAFSSLSKDDRSILLLAAWEGLSNDELGVVLKCSPGAAANRLSRARARFEDAAAAVGREGTVS
jgi:RNA polymerase sigma-70 factor (ECF subfamily)